MISIELYVLILLAISAVSMYFIIGVLVKQIRLLKAPFEEAEKYDDETIRIVRRFRYVLFIISLTIIVMGLIPIAINLLTLLVDTGRPNTVKPVSFVYSLGVHVQGLLLAYLVSRLYRLASSQKDATDFTQHHLEEELKQEQLK